MTTIRCVCQECVEWLNGTCSRRTVKVVGTKCLDFSRRKSQFRHKTTTVRCDSRTCGNYRYGECKATEITMRADGCVTSSGGGEGNGGGRQDEGDRQILTRHQHT